MDIIYRKSTQRDFELIDQLLKSCFGDRSKCGALNNLDNRYFLAFDDDKLIAMTGLECNSPAFDGAEIDWTCVLSEYRGRGIVTCMIRDVIKNCNKDIYCSCLRLHNHDKVNLYYSMRELGFKCISREYKSFSAPHSEACSICIYNNGDNCRCYEDLYVKKYTQK